MDMRVFHDSRDAAYRSPYGAVEPGATVTLRVDVRNLPGAIVTLRTWVDGVGETRHEMRPAQTPGDNGAVRYEAEVTPREPGVVWYYFIVEEAGGRTWRYGARDGCYGGAGRICEWEPPSFALAVCRPEDAPHILGGIFDGADAMRRAPMELMVRFLRGELPATQVVEAWETLRETCSPEVLRHAFDLLGSFEQPRLFALLAGAQGREAEAEVPPNYHVDPAKGGLAKGRLWCACLVQMLAMDNPVVFDGTGAPAGDDAVQAKAPLYEDRDCEDIVRNALELHDALPAFRSGSLCFFAVNDDVLGFWRCGGGGVSVCVLVNASLRNAYDVAVPVIAEAVSDVLGGYDVSLVPSGERPELRVGSIDTGRYAAAHLYQLGSAVLYFHPEQRLQQPMEPGMGVLAHVTSLPADGGKGTLGAPARAFVDWLADAGVRYWQMLPVNPTDEYGSPYAGISAFAGNADLLEGAGAACAGAARIPAGTRELAASPAFREFCEREAEWLEPYACFMAIRQLQGPGKRWQEWPAKYRRFDPRAVAADEQLAAWAQEWRLSQFAFARQWHELREYANARGVRIIGDMPIYVSADSSDVWAHPEIFQLRPDGTPEVVAGCPPDQFAPEGQVWGNPVYDWESLRESGYDWWLRRLRRAFELYDVVRLDHFIGFARYFSIPVDGKATAGVYRPGPGLDFFRKAHEAFGPLPIIAEDLGYITPSVRTLVAACGFPGMDVVQFVDGNDPLSGYRPRPGKVVYTGTHDNQTLRGYAAGRYPQLDADAVATELEERAARCKADVCVFPLQDILGLDDEARMNTPGTSTGNWQWQAEAADLARAAGRLAELAQIHRDHGRD